MIQMQLRTPGDRTIEDVVSELSLTILESIKRELDSMEVPFDSFHAVGQRIESAIEPYLKAFDACGSDPVCLEGIQNKHAHEGDRIYILQLPTGLEPLVQSVITEVLQSVQLSLDKDASEALNRRVLATMERDLGRYTFYNPVCGVADVCHASKPISPWIRRNQPK